jgi:UDP-N-acetylglucosamine--N-acetylmuramyl-(pentapeptide) pyrophosphoryl-undecaprenol N-acetylglucosamine transferase
MSAAAFRRDGVSPRCALVMAGGTGGHIFPALAVAQALQARGWSVHWLGGRGSPDKPSMESRLVPQHGLALHTIVFGGLRGKGWGARLLMPWRLLRACWQTRHVLRDVQPVIVLGFGGYVTVPGGLVSAVRGVPLVLHEQNAVAGLANRLLARLARRVVCAFPDALPRSQWVGNPVRTAFEQVTPPAQRLAARSGPLKLLVLGGSLGAAALNERVPAALALLPPATRPQVRHQCGVGASAAVQARYNQAGVAAECSEFIDDVASAMAEADLLVCRAGASTVSEIASVGAAAIFVPFPHAVDDHQTRNARFLVDAGAAWLLPQAQLQPQSLADMLQKTERPALMQLACAAHSLRKLGAAMALVSICEEEALA